MDDLSSERVYTFPGGVWLSRTHAKDKQIVRELFIKRDPKSRSASEKRKGILYIYRDKLSQVLLMCSILDPSLLKNLQDLSYLKFFDNFIKLISPSNKLSAYRQERNNVNYVLGNHFYNISK